MGGALVESSTIIRVAAPESPQAPFAPAYQRGLVTLTGAELLKRDFPAREFLLSPWLPSKGLAMIFSERGIGKTWIGLNIAHAMAGGGEFLRWRASRPSRVVYIDGEMPAGVLKDRYAAIVTAANFDAPEDYFRLVASDLQPDGLPDLADPTAQRFYDDAIADADAIFVDNLSTVCRTLRENEADSWGPIQAWCLRQRAAGKSVLLIHHAGKGGGQRGTSRKEDVLDSVICLKRPIDYDSSEGARFEVHYSKARGFWGDDAAPFEARLVDGQWIVGEIAVDDCLDTIRAMKERGATVREIADRLGMSRSAVGRKLKGDRE
ncbi:AAA family ATPase [Methylocystis sp. MJC1]|nr:AAA family ATPase [Methylocystis sp. MJC1]UZX11638.1 AAA family ATPase [Methylocystis sp. MJC1]